MTFDNPLWDTCCSIRRAAEQIQEARSELADLQGKGLPLDEWAGALDDIEFRLGALKEAISNALPR